MITEYTMLTDDTLSEVLAKTGWPFSECVHAMTKGYRMGGEFAVFQVHGEWRRVFIHHSYDQLEFMLTLRDRLTAWARKGG